MKGHFQGNQISPLWNLCDADLQGSIAGPSTSFELQKYCQWYLSVSMKGNKSFMYVCCVCLVYCDDGIVGNMVNVLVCLDTLMLLHQVQIYTANYH